MDDLRVRFTQSDDSELTSLMLDLAAENKVLTRSIERANLSNWVKALVMIIADEDDGDVEMGQ